METPPEFWQSVIEGDLDAVTDLLDKGVDIEAKNPDNVSLSNYYY